MLRCVRHLASFYRPTTRDPLVEVSLDGAETKSEDYQRDVRKPAAQIPMTALI